MRLIDADALIDKYGDWYTEEGTEEGYIGTIKGIVDSMPTIEERKTGKWIDDGTELGCCCDNCGVTLGDYFGGDLSEIHLHKMPSYCPNCGARMS